MSNDLLVQRPIVRAENNGQQVAGHDDHLSWRGQMSTEVCIKLFARRRIKRRDRRQSSLSISLNFYQTILGSSPQTRFLFDIKKLLLLLIIDALTLFPEKQRMTCWSICPNSVEFPKKVTLLVTVKQKVQCNLQCCVTPVLHKSVCYSLCCVSLRHDGMKLVYYGVLFLRRVYSKAAKHAKEKKKSRQRYTALSYNCMENKMFLSKNYRSKWLARPEFDQSSPRSGQTLSVDWPLFSALYCRKKNI